MRGSPISSSGTNTLVSTAAYDIPDDILFTLGDDSDIAMLLRSATLSADAELTGVIEGTSDHLGNAANSLIISNVTNDGDVHILVSKAGNSHTAFLADGSTGDTILNASTGQSVDIYIAGTKLLDYATGAFAFQQSVTISSTGTLTLGAITLSGAIAGGDQAFTGVGDMTFTNGSILAASVTDTHTLLVKAGGLSGTSVITITSLDAGDTLGLANVNALTAVGNLDIGAYDLRAATITADGLTATRVVFAGTNGVLSDDADFTFVTDTLTVTNIGATTLTGAVVVADANTIEMGDVAIIKTGTTAADYFRLDAYNTNDSAAKEAIRIVNTAVASAGAVITVSGDATFNGALNFGSNVTINSLTTSTVDDEYLDIQAYDVDGTAYVSVIRVQNANAVELGFFAATPVAKQTGADALNTGYVTTDIDTDAELVAVINVITTEVNALRTALNNYGLTTVV